MNICEIYNLFLYLKPKKKGGISYLSVQYYLSNKYMKNYKNKILLALNYQFVPSIIWRIQFCSLQNIIVYL